MGEIRREFLGFGRPLLAHAAERCAERLSSTARGIGAIFVLPGRRAARRFEELLIERLGPTLSPPRVISDGELAAALAREPLALASPLERRLAWRLALGSLASDEREQLWRNSSGAGGERALAASCARVSSELAADDVDATRLASAATGAEAARWRAFARVEAVYRGELERHGLIEPADAARWVRERELARSDAELHLIGWVDPPRAARALIATLERPVTAWVAGDQAWADDFDELGALRVERWAERDVPLETERWTIVDGPDDQARAAIEELARLAPGASPDEIAVGVLDPEVRPFLERRASQAGLAARYAGGVELASTSAARALAALREFLGERRFDALAALVRHPSVEAALARALGADARGTLAALDRYAREQVPSTFGERFAPRADGHAALTALRAALLESLGALASERRATLSTWAGELARWLADLEGDVDLGARDAQGWQRAQAAQALAELFEEARACRVGAAELSACVALELFEERIASARVPPPPAGDRPTIELYGWLELALDDAPHAIVTGFDEGSLPTPAPTSAWLDDELRRELGLTDERRRLARDVWAMTVLCRSRSTLWISSRRDLARDPRMPSRLAFRAPRERVLERVARAFPGDASDRDPQLAPAQVERFAVAFGPSRALERISVTAFKTYLASPYQFYLRHVLSLETVDDGARELDPQSFGSFAHEVLRAFGEHELRSSHDPAAIAAFLEDALDRRARERLDPSVRPAARVQLEQLRLRLRRFAHWQARVAAEGWRIERVEYRPKRPVRVETARGALELAGRIDRIDFHPVQRTWRVLDYKTGETRAKASGARRKNGAWVDLQLPLYRRLARELTGDAPAELGYVALDSGNAADLLDLASWTEPELDEADACARDVVEAVLAGRFGEVGRDAPPEPIFAALCGFGLAAQAGVEDEEDAP